MVTSCNFEEMTLFLQSGCKTNTLWTFLIISETHHVPPDFEIYVEWYLTIKEGWMGGIYLYCNLKLKKREGDNPKDQLPSHTVGYISFHM